MNVTNASLVVQNRLTTADPIITYDRSQELQQFNRLDETWINLLKTLRMNETRLTKRNVPRLMVTHNNRKSLKSILIYFFNKKTII